MCDRSFQLLDQKCRLFRVAVVMLMPMFMHQASFGQTSTPTATISFHVVDVFGEPLPYEVVRFVAVDSKQDYSKLFAGRTASGLPYSEYSYVLRRSDFPHVASIEGTLSVNRDSVWKTVVYHGTVIVVNGNVAEPLITAPKDFRIRGRVESANPAEPPVWVRLQPAYEAGGLDVKVDEHGTFSVTEYLRGTYVISVFGRSRPLYSALVIIRARSATPKTLVIDLSTPSERILTVE